MGFAELGRPACDGQYEGILTYILGYQIKDRTGKMWKMKENVYSL